jgi:hypothetical protein
VNNTPIILFRDLAIGDTFDCIDDAHPAWNTFFSRCMKTSSRMYATQDHPTLRYHVGSINVQVFHVEEAAAPTTRKCAAWLDCGNLAVPLSDISFRGFCPSCERVAQGETYRCSECGGNTTHWPVERVGRCTPAGHYLPVGHSHNVDCGEDRSECSTQAAR